AATKATGAGLLFACLSAFLSLIFGTLEVSGKAFRAGGYAGEFLAKELSEYLNRTGSIIVILTLIFLAVIMSTQFSFGRFFGAIVVALKSALVRGWDSFQEWRAERRREKQRREVIAKHTKKGEPAAARVPAGKPADAAEPLVAALKTWAAKKRDVDDGDAEPAPEKKSLWGSAKAFAPPKPPKVTLPAPPLPLSDPEPAAKAPAERRKGDYALPPMALLDAPKTQRKFDERELMERARLLEEKCREFSVDGSVVQIHPGPVVTTFEFKPNAGVKYAKITNLEDDLCLAMQAESV